MTVEHAKEKANISEVSYLQMDKVLRNDLIQPTTVGGG